MALPILDGNQSATTLSSILTSGEHIPAHTVVSLGTQAITDIVNATSAGLTNTQLRASAVTVGGTVTVGNSLTISSLPAISGTVTVGVLPDLTTSTDFEQVGVGIAVGINSYGSIPVLIVDFPLPAGTNRIGVVTIGAGTVTLGAGTAQIGSVTASISNSVTISSLPALVAGTAQIGSVTASINNFPATQAISIASVTIGNSVTIGSLPAISGTVTANTFALQGTAVTTSDFTSTTASTLLANFNAGREVLTIFSEGPGTLFVCGGATCTTIAYQVRLSSGDYYEVPNHQSSITHSAVFQTAGTARVTEVS